MIVHSSINLSVVSWKRKELSTMKINDSTVVMFGKRDYSKYQETKVESSLVRAYLLNDQQQKGSADVGVSISKESKSLYQQLQEKQQDQSMHVGTFLSETDKAKAPVDSQAVDGEQQEDHMLSVLRRLLEALKRMRKGDYLSDDGFVKKVATGKVFEMDSHFEQTLSRVKQVDLSQHLNVVDLRSNSATMNSGGSTAWVRHVEKSSFVMEQETTTFSATGVAHTADGREIEFGVDLEMSRGFVGTFYSVEDTEAILTDPLVINLENGYAQVGDQKFRFDLDNDGKEEEISKLNSGSGFLAYDKNGDGKINDGSELFGTKSGDGFVDLAKYDKDGNGWIDENDDIFQKLRVWTKDENGADKLLSLKDADVGAIYLGSANTQFHLNDTANTTNAVIQKTGVFLKESGGVGTVQHVDLAV